MRAERFDALTLLLVGRQSRRRLLRALLGGSLAARPRPGVAQDAGDRRVVLAPPGPPAITAGPTVSGVAATAATIAWATDQAADGVVEYGPTTRLGLAVVDPTPATAHRVALTGLTPGTTYHYRVRSRNARGEAASPGEHAFTLLAAGNVAQIVRSAWAAVERARTYTYKVYDLNNGRALAGGGEVNLNQGSTYVSQNGGPDVYVVGSAVYERNGGQWVVPEVADPTTAARDGLSQFIKQGVAGWTAQGTATLGGSAAYRVERVQKQGLVTEDDQLWIDATSFLPVKWVLHVTGQVAPPPYAETDYADFGAAVTVQAPSAALAAARAPQGPPSTAPAQSTAGTVSSGTVLYQADTSGGFANWSYTSDWQEVNGALVNDGSAAGSITVPYQPTIADYAVEAEIQVNRPGQPVSGQEMADFGIFARSGGGGGYGAGVQWDLNGLLGARIWDVSEILAQGQFDPGSAWHTYRLEVKGNDIRLLVDVSLLLETTDDRQTAPGIVGMWSSGVQLTVRSFRVIAL